MIDFLTDPRIAVFINAVKAMRERQNAYFKTRDREVMIECKQLEKEVDRMVKEFMP